VLLFLSLTSEANAENANDRVKQSSTSIGVFFDGGIESTFFASIQYIFANSVFLKGGLSTSQTTLISNGASEDIKSYNFSFGLGETMAIHNFTVVSLTATCQYYFYDISSGGKHFPAVKMTVV
jgi:hypothetical protein